ncbi:hypothetical protein DFH11DRAFT_1544379 [Phellopilus nigrolimitatus]|nr:hypothetical protein DFH11DRAFT_1544379 [Phellopilus nigrolimitatus]
MSNNAPFNRENTFDPSRDLYVPCRDVDTTVLGYRNPQEFSCYGEGLQPSGNTRVLCSELQGPDQLPLAMPIPGRLATQISGLDEGISCSGPSMPSGAAQSPYVPFGPLYRAESNSILPPRPRGPISTTLDGGTNRALPLTSAWRTGLHTSDVPYSQEDPFDPLSLTYLAIRHEVDTTAPEIVCRFSHRLITGLPSYQSGEETPQNGGGERTNLAINQHRPSLPSSPIPDDPSHFSKICPPPQPRERVSATLGVEEDIAHDPLHASGRSPHENFSLGVSSVTVEPPSPIEQQPSNSILSVSDVKERVSSASSRGSRDIIFAILTPAAAAFY